jgi:hypothetical protein
MTDRELTRDGAVRLAAKSPWVTVAAGVAAAVVANLVIYLIGRLAGGSFEFTAGGQTAMVQPATVAGFSAVPLGVGVILVALLAPRFGWVVPVATVVAPLLAVVTIFIMTIPADLDGVSTITLAACHVTIALISFLAVRTIGAGARRRATIH